VGADALWLAAQAARRAWPADPMVGDLLYAESVLSVVDGSNPLVEGCCTELRPCAEHFDDVVQGHRDAQEDAYLEHGEGGTAA
jgi:hypothetical protein